MMDIKSDAVVTRPFSNTRIPNTETAVSEIEKSHFQLRLLSKDLSHALKQNRLGGIRDILALVNECSQILINFQTRSKNIITSKEQAAIARLVRGSVMHFLLIGLAHCSALPAHESVYYAKTWRDEFLRFLKELPEHFKMTFTDQKSISEDPWVIQSLWDPESEPLLTEIN
jgi:hypothetical protein